MLSVTPVEVRDAWARGKDIVLVCAYEDDEKCRSTGIENSLTYHEFVTLLPTFDRTREIIFFCDCKNDEKSIERAEEYHRKGYPNAKVLEGGVKAWRMSSAASSTARK
jgi:rhodanese-related sulfurtransferase